MMLFKKDEGLKIDPSFLQMMLLKYISNPSVKLKSGDFLVSFTGFKKDKIAFQKNKKFNQFLENNKIKVVYGDTCMTFSIM